MSEPLLLDADRCFDPDQSVRRVARELYQETKRLPIVSPHGHVDPRLLADDAPLAEPTALFLLPDHYLLRMLYSQGVPLERLGIAPNDGSRFEEDPRAAWQLFGERFHLFLGTPSGYWLNHQLHDVFGVRTKLAGDSAARIYDELQEKLRSPDFRPRALFERFNIEVLATTDAATDSLEHHQRIRSSGWNGRVIPTFRPDALFQVAAPSWRAALKVLESQHGGAIGDYQAFVAALAGRRAFFRSQGATATDHGVESPRMARLPDEDAADTFRRALAGSASQADQGRFEAHMLMEMARLSVDDGMVMQLHAGSLRSHNRPLFERFGPDRGADIPVATEYTRNLREALNAYGNDARFRLLVFTLDESTYARELAPLAGHYPALRLGPAWWFHDSIEGMKRYRERTTETAGIWNTAGFNDDTRAFCSIPARHDLSRRLDANWLAGLVARHLIDLNDARRMAKALAVELARDAYRLEAGKRESGKAGA